MQNVCDNWVFPVLNSPKASVMAMDSIPPPRSLSSSWQPLEILKMLRRLSEHWKRSSQIILTYQENSLNYHYRYLKSRNKSWAPLSPFKLQNCFFNLIHFRLRKSFDLQHYSKYFTLKKEPSLKLLDKVFSWSSFWAPWRYRFQPSWVFSSRQHWSRGSARSPHPSKSLRPHFPGRLKRHSRFASF